MISIWDLLLISTRKQSPCISNDIYTRSAFNSRRKQFPYFLNDIFRDLNGFRGVLNHTVELTTSSLVIDCQFVSMLWSSRIRDIRVNGIVVAALGIWTKLSIESSTGPANSKTPHQSPVWTKTQDQHNDTANISKCQGRHYWGWDHDFIVESAR